MQIKCVDVRLSLHLLSPRLVNKQESNATAREYGPSLLFPSPTNATADKQRSTASTQALGECVFVIPERYQSLSPVTSDLKNSTKQKLDIL